MLSIEAGVTPTNIRNPKKALLFESLSERLSSSVSPLLPPRLHNPAGSPQAPTDDRTTETTQVSYYFFYVSIY